ncbi:hypothetical protein N825_03900 [Skermanella stibiiresistens SB22]|uniref:Uncharacterized protein n=1 Tax=Skermanella stibiiresistens SB22 TaxID=1385369 RepID=W9GSP2_9PROT|nr:hypothetical protein N825_03900 [Skermanella stibiiresistens SB22]
MAVLETLRDGLFVSVRRIHNEIRDDVLGGSLSACQLVADVVLHAKMPASAHMKAGIFLAGTSS